MFCITTQLFRQKLTKFETNCQKKKFFPLPKFFMWMFSLHKYATISPKISEIWNYLSKYGRKHWKKKRKRGKLLILMAAYLAGLTIIPPLLAKRTFWCKFDPILRKTLFLCIASQIMNFGKICAAIETLHSWLRENILQ